MDEAKFRAMRRIMEEQIPFNRVIGIEIIEAEGGRAALRFDFREDLIGNYKMGILHGVGGLVDCQRYNSGLAGLS